jgi:hypothetical protein
MHKSFVRFIALVATALSLISVTAFAQVITTSSLNGTVRTDQGQPVANATISVTHEPTGSIYTATARADGTYVLRGLRPGGPYTISSTAPTFAKSEIREVYLDIDRGADVNLTMRGEVVQLEAFQVTASATDTMFDPNQTGSGSYLNNRDIRNLPGGDRSINSLARLDPRISYNRDPQDRAISVAGTSNRYNSIQVDGVNASDPFGLNGNNTAAERNVIPLDSLEALAINTSPYYSRNAGFVGAQINAITKSGTNQFHGSAYYTYRGRTLLGQRTVADTIDEIPRPLANFSEETKGATLGGPIIPKKLFFYVAYEKVDENRVAPSPVSRLDDATIKLITDTAKTLGFTTGSAQPPSANKLTDENLLAKLDWQINADHRATFRYNKVESSRPTFPNFGTGISENNFSYDTAWYQQNISNESYIGQLISRWNNKLNTELSVSRSKYHSERGTADPRQPYVTIRSIPVPGSSNTSFATFGTESSSQSNVLDVKTDTVEAFASYELADNHTLQGGIQYDTADIYNLFVQNTAGSYTFSGLPQFQSLAALNNGTLNYYTYAYNQIIDGVEPAARFSEANAGFFLNDAWRVTPNLKVDIGARIDIAMLPDAVPYNNVDTDAATPGIQNFESIFGYRNDATYDGTKVIQPRVGFNWQPDFDGKKTTIRGGVGLFYGRAPRVWISNSYSNTGMNYKSWTAGTNITGSPLAPIISADPTKQAAAGALGSVMTVNFMDPDFELPSKWKSNLAVERELGLWGMKATAEIEFAKTKADVFYENVNIAATGTGPDGRTLYWSGVNAGTGMATGTKVVSTAFVNSTASGARIIKLTNADQGESQSYIVSLERPRTKSGWYWKGSYVRTNAKEVAFGTSSVAASNWNNRVGFNINAQELHTAELEIRDRILITVTKDFELVKNNPTTVSLLYEGRSGYPFSFVYNTDINGDTGTQNDLVYVPRRAGDTKVRFATTTDMENFYKIVDRFGLEEGTYSAANSNRYPWVNQFDFSVKQEVKLPFWRHKLVLGADILNVGNLLNSKWGIIRGSNQFFTKKETVANVTYDTVNKQYVYSSVNTSLANGTYSTTIDGKSYTGSGFAPSLGRGEPAATRWSVLFSARYEF